MLPSRYAPLVSVDDYYRSLPRRPAGAGVLFTGDGDKVLLVKPTYKAGWDIPGGVIDEGETPREAAEREVLEELGLARVPYGLLCVDWMRPGVGEPGSTQFVFDGRALADRELSEIQLPADELSDWRLVTYADLDRFLPPPLARRVRAALTARESGPVYLEDAFPVP